MADADGDLKCSANHVLKMDYKKHILDALPRVFHMLFYGSYKLS